MNYFNENDKTAVAWLRNLIAAGHLPKGDVDDRSITDVQASDLGGYTQCHFFAGIGGWPLALQLAGWPTTRPVWSGSCPCQPFSQAGRHGREADKRHLWPEFQRLIAECRPPVVFGEQVASLSGRAWLSRVRTELETLEYGVGAVDLCAASIGAPHIRQRLWWVGNAKRTGREGRRPSLRGEPSHRPGGESLAPAGFGSGGVADAIGKPVRARPGGMGGETPAESSQGIQRQRAGSDAGHNSTPSGVADARLVERGGWDGLGDAEAGAQEPTCADKKGSGDRQSAAGLREVDGIANDSAGSGVDNAPGDGAGRELSTVAGGNREDNRLPWATGSSSPWAGYTVVPCLDGKVRRIEPGTPPLVDGFPGRVEQLRAYGNAIVPQVAAEFIKAYATAAGF